MNYNQGMEPLIPQPIALDPDSYESLNRQAKQSGLSVSELLKTWIARMAPPNPVTYRLTDFLGVGCGQAGSYGDPDLIVPAIRELRGRTNSGFKPRHC